MARYVVTTFRFRQLSTTSLLITRQQIEIKTMNFQQPNTTISTRELRLLIEDHLKALWEEKSFLSTQYAQAANLIPPLMIWGAPGVGKSTLIRELAQSMNIGFIDVRLAQREPVDMRGLPVPDQDSVISGIPSAKPVMVAWAASLWSSLTMDISHTAVRLPRWSTRAVA